MIFSKYISKYILKYIIFFIIGICALIICDWFQLRYPEIIGEVINGINEGKFIDPNQSEFLSLIFEILKISIILVLGRVAWRLSLLFSATKIEAHLRHDMFLKAMRLSTTYYQRHKIGNIMSWLTTDLEAIEDFLGFGVVTFIDGVFFTILALAKMFKLDWALALISLLPILLIALWSALVEKYMAIKWTKRQESYDKLYDFSYESFSGIRVIKAFVKENEQILRFSKLAYNDELVNVDFIKISIIFNVIIYIIIFSIFAFLMGLGGYFVYAYSTGSPVVIFNHPITLSAGTLVIFIGYFDYLIWPMMAIGQVVTLYSKAKASYKRIASFLDENEEISDHDEIKHIDTLKGKIEFKNVTFNYPLSDHKNFKNVSFVINPGEKIGVVGKVGSGKSTISSLLLRLYNIDDNSIFLDDNDINTLSIKEIRNNIAFVPQESFLFLGNIEENIAFGVEKATNDEIVAASKFADIYDNIRDFPNKFLTECGEKGQTLSGGQKQRVGIARAYIKKSPILIMDDSVSAVDVDTEGKILENIKKYRKDLTTIVIASRVSTVKDFDKILVMDKGYVIAFDSPKNLLKTCELYKNMVRLQELVKMEGGDIDG